MKFDNDYFKIIFAVIIVILICFMTYFVVGMSVAAEKMADSDMTITGHAATIIHHNTQEVMLTTNDGTYNSEFSKRTIMSAGTQTNIKLHDNTNNQYYNTLDSSTYTDSSNTAFVSERYGMEDQKSIESLYAYLDSNRTPSHQYVEAEYLQVGSDGSRYQSGTVIDDANMTTSMVAEGNDGYLVEKHESSTGVGFNPSSSEMNFEKKTYGTTSWIANESGYFGSIDWTWKDHSNTVDVINTTNKTADNLSVTNITA